MNRGSKVWGDAVQSILTDARFNWQIMLTFPAINVTFVRKYLHLPTP